MATESIMADDGEDADGEGKERNPYRSDSGEYTTEFSTDTAVDALRTLDGEGTTSEVGDEMGAARRTAYNYLVKAEEEGHVTRREVANSLLWRLVDDSKEGT